MSSGGGGGRRALVRALTLTLTLTLAARGAAWGLGKVEGESASFEATGNLRLLVGYLHYGDGVRQVLPSLTDEGIGAGVGRLILKGDVLQWMTWELHGYLDLSRNPGAGLGGALATAATFRSPYRTTNLAWRFWQSGAVTGELGIDRMSVHGRFGPVDLTLGRFPVNHSVTLLFTPNDFFAPFSTTAINKAYKPAVDAVRAGLSIGALSSLEVTGVLGSDATGSPAWAQSAVLLRLSTVILGLDAALLGGKLAERWVVGGSLQGTLGPIGVRAEGHAGFADRNGDGTLGETNSLGATPPRTHGRVSAGAGYRHPWHNLSIDAEYAFYSDGSLDPAGEYVGRARRLFPDDLTLLGQHYVGLVLGGEIVPILRASVLGMVNAGDGSGVAVASLLYDISDEASFAGGLLVPWGRAPVLDMVTGLPTLRSELGLLPLTVFLESRFYF